LYRSGQLADASDADVEALASLGIKFVVDLRREGDAGREGHDRVPAGTTVVSVPIGDFDTHLGVDLRAIFASRDTAKLREAFPPGRAREAMMHASRTNALDQLHRTRYGEMFRAVLAAEGEPVLVHCSGGKDRTGWAIAVLLLAIGVTMDDVVADYLLSNEVVARRLAALEPLRAEGFDPDEVAPLVVVHGEYLDAAVAAAEATYGSFSGYLEAGLGIAPSEIERLRDQLLAPS
jgi:protein-tyrosine phosphatase